MTIQASDYDSYADEVARYTAAREERGVAGDGLLREMLELLGDVTGLRVLDAACGDGYLTRVLADRGARVTGIDIGSRLIERASRRDPDGSIDYRVADLSKGLPGELASFDAVVSFLALNDVIEYRGFIATTASLLRPGGRLVLAFNSPYGSAVRGNVPDYFDTGATSPYRGLWAAGIKTYLQHRTLSRDHCFDPQPESILPDGFRFPRFMLLAFTKP